MPIRKRKKKAERVRVSQARGPQQPKQKNIVVLFADIVGCSEISNHMNLSEYNAFLDGFQEHFKEVCDHYKALMYDETEYDFFKRSVRGDEGCLMIFAAKDDSSLARDIDVAIKIAFDLKRVWLFTENNIRRIEHDGLLPVDIAIGVHTGKVWVNKDEDGQYRPEGYAINLAKRIESESRRGKFTHILLSEAARGQLHNLKDEDTYTFDNPFAMLPKGISRTIKGFEIKHHHLRTDWMDSTEEATVLYEQIGADKLRILDIACKANPTNLWLAEEFIYLDLIRGYRELRRLGKEEDPKALSKAYKDALHMARRIANSDLRDAGTLAIWGFVEGERGEYSEELRRYREALDLEPQHGNIHWYKALGMSYKVYRELMTEKLKVSDFHNDSEHNKGILETLCAFDRAFELKPFNPWIAYDYACELAWWSQADENLRKAAIKMLRNAFALNSDTKEQATDEEYLEPIIDDPEVKKYLKN